MMAEGPQPCLLCIGYGYVAQALASRMRARGWRVSAGFRDGKRMEAARAQGIEAHTQPACDEDSQALWRRLVRGANAILLSVPPGPAPDGPAHNGPDPVFHALAPILKAHPSPWVGYLSSIGVYGPPPPDTEDGTSFTEACFVGEDAKLPDEAEFLAPRQRRRLRAELAWAELLPGLVRFRLGAIYGPGRNTLEALRAGRPPMANAPRNRLIHRIHRDDIAAFLLAAISRDERGEIFNLVDDKPCPSCEVAAYARALLAGSPAPLPVCLQSPGRRIRNDKAKTVLATNLLYPGYREGLQAILAGLHA